MAQLEAAEIPAVRDSDDNAGIFGLGFAGPTSRGITVRVPVGAFDAAREAVNLVDGTA